MIIMMMMTKVEVVKGQTAECLEAPPSPNYTPKLYGGFWYEVAKIQTAGGAFFERNCVCTVINISYTDAEGNALAYQSCRQKTASGPVTLVVGNLTANPQRPGNFIESMALTGQSVNYTIVQISDQDPQYAVEYDCGDSPFGVNYCLHFMSRTPTMDPATLDMLVQKTAAYNTLNLPLKMTQQQGCSTN